MAERVHALDAGGEGFDDVGDDGLRAAGDLPEAGDALVGADFYQHDLGMGHALMRGPAGLREWVKDDFGDFQGGSSVGRLMRVALLVPDTPMCASAPRGAAVFLGLNPIWRRLSFTISRTPQPKPLRPPDRWKV
jgi:hypothetical protein